MTRVMARQQTFDAAARSAGSYARARGLQLGWQMVALVSAALLVLLAAGPVFGLRGGGLILVELLAIGAMLATKRWYSPRIDRWLQGAEGERVVGAILAEMQAEGWHAIHDVSLGRGNGDHILVGPGGIFTVETKSHRARVHVNRLEPRMLKQAYAEKKLIERITGLDVQPLLVFSQAWLVGSVPARRDGVVVLPARMLRHYISRRRTKLTAEHAEQLHRRLAAALSPAS